MVLFGIHQKFKDHFLNELRDCFKESIFSKVTGSKSAESFLN